VCHFYQIHAAYKPKTEKRMNHQTGCYVMAHSAHLLAHHPFSPLLHR
jgi:hypothetical protein